MNPWLLTLPIAYLLGSIPFGYLLVRFFRKEDIRAIGSGNIGATNVARSGAKGLGIATLALDCLKGFAAVMLAKHVASPSLNPANLDLAALAAVAAILGHIFPVWLSFKGGKGIATALGVFLALSWPTALCALGVFLLVTLISRYVSLGSILGATALPLFMLWFQPYRSPIFVGGTIFISLLCILKHAPNIARLKSGTENKLGAKKSIPSPDDEGSLA